MKPIVFACGAFLLVACGERAAAVDDAGADQRLFVDSEQRQRDGIADSLHPSQSAPCQGSREHDFRLVATGLGAWEGQTVWAFATSDLHGKANHDFRITGRVVGGEVNLVCRNAVDDDFSYPGAVLWIDANSSGACESDSDVLADNIYYGWNDDVTTQVAINGTSQRRHDLCDRVNSWL